MKIMVINKGVIKMDMYQKKKGKKTKKDYEK